MNGPRERHESASAQLARLSFSDARKAESLLADPALAALAGDGGPGGGDRSGLLAALGQTADPDAALLGLVRLAEAAQRPGRPVPVDTAGLGELLRTGGADRRRLLGVLGASSALTDHLVAHPEHWPAAARPRAWSSAQRSAGLVDAVGEAARGNTPAYDALRVAYREQMLGIAATDVAADDALAVFPETAAALADLAGAALEAALAIAAQEQPEAAAATRLAVIGMGKAGGRELNYVSDVDVIFVAEPVEGVAEEEALAAAGQLATGLMRACSASTPEGTLWPVDAALRPEGKQGPLVRTVASHRQYYQRWAKTWEFQALLKARVLAGDTEVGARYLEAVSPLVWGAAGRENFVEDVQAMRRRVEAHVPAGEAKRQLKLGAGGLRDIEFSVQLLQLVHGRTDESLRSGTTLEALAALSAGGYVGRPDAADLDAAYRLLRSLEHRIQLHRMRRTHLMPTAPADLRRLGRSLGHREDPVAEVEARWQDQAREVRRLHEKLFYRPLLASAARLTSDDVQLTPEAARARLGALGFRDPAGAWRHLEALTQGYSRTAAIHRQLLPVMLGWFADEADPDAGLLAFRRVSESLGGTPWYAKMLRDERHSAERLSHVLARSRYAADMLTHMPEAVQLFGESDGLVPRGRAALHGTMRSAITRKDDAPEAVEAARVVRRHELFRTVVADLVGELDLVGVGHALTDLAEALIEAALYVATKKVGIERGTPVPADLAVVGMGRFGGRELGYSSDADVLFVHRPHEGVDEAEATEAATAVVVELRRVLALAGPDPKLDLDADLRPEGKAGPLVRTLAGYAAYYERWADSWEFHALLRARPVAGAVDLGEQFVALVDPLRYRAGGLDGGRVREIRRLKARMESERLPRGADPKLHFKLGLGGISDVEWTVQLLQLQHAHEVPGLRVVETLPALAAARTAGLVTPEEEDVLAHAWRLASGLRNAGLLWRGRATDALPGDHREREGMARILGLGPGGGSGLVEDYLRATRRARAVTERHFYGREASKA